MTEEFKWHKFGDIYPADTVSNFYVREPELFRLGPRLPAGVVARAFRMVVPIEYEFLTNLGNEFETTFDVILGPPQAGEGMSVQGMKNEGIVGMYVRKGK